MELSGTAQAVGAVLLCDNSPASRAQLAALQQELAGALFGYLRTCESLAASKITMPDWDGINQIRQHVNKLMQVIEQHLQTGTQQSLHAARSFVAEHSPDFRVAVERAMQFGQRGRPVRDARQRLDEQALLLQKQGSTIEMIYDTLLRHADKEIRQEIAAWR